MRGRVIISGVAGVMALGVSAAFADSAPMPNPFSKFSTADAVIVAIQSDFARPGGHVRVTVYDGETNFLENAAGKHDATVSVDGVALVRLADLTPGDYSFVAYLDENGDGKLNRNVLGKPKEPFIFSNNIKPKLRKPTFAETKVAVAPGEVVVLRLEN